MADAPAVPTVRCRAVSDHARTGTITGEVYDVPASDVRIAAGVLVPIPAPVNPPADTPKRRRG